MKRLITWSAILIVVGLVIMYGPSLLESDRRCVSGQSYEGWGFECEEWAPKR